MPEDDREAGETVRLVAPEATLETPRLLLESLVPSHAAVLFDGLRDERLYRFIPDDPPQSPADLEAIYRHLAARRSPDGREAWLNWAMRLRDAETYVGTLQASVDPHRSGLVAYTVFVPWQQQGYATEGLARLLDHLFADYGVSVVVAEIDTRNEPSISLVRRLRFEEVAVRTAADFFKGAASDEFRFELRAPDAARGDRA